MFINLVEKGKCILANNFIDILNRFVRDTPTPSNNTQALAFTLNNLAPDLQILHDLRLNYPRNLLFGYLNINSLRNKIIDVREIISYLQLDYFVLSETKLNDSFPSAQFDMSGYEIRARRDRDGMGGGIMEYVRRGVICKRLKDFETTISESICSELLISKKKWFCMSIYRPPNYNNLSTFFDEITLSLNKAALKFENFIVMGDFNMDANAPGPGKDKLDKFCNLFEKSFCNLFF